MGEEKEWGFLEEGMFLKKGQTTEIKIGEGLTRRFKVKKPFKLFGFKGNKLVVVIPVTLDTLKGLGFISKVKEKRR